MKIGVGVITLGNRQLKDYLLCKTSDFFVYTDHEKKGPGHARNEVIKHFYDAGYDFVFCFDDDTAPIMRGWEKYFIEASERENIQFFGLPSVFEAKRVSTRGDIDIWNSVLAQFGMYSRKLIETVGYYNTEYDRYGYEDTAYVYRCVKSGTCGDGSGFFTPMLTPCFIHSDDVWCRNPVQNIPTEEKQRLIKKNRVIFEKETTGDRIFYPYEQSHI